MKSLVHNGVLVLPKYKAKGYVIFVKKQAIQLTDETEEMSFAWCRKLGTDYVKDPVFRKNFFTDLTAKLGIPYTEDINFEQLIFQVERQRKMKELLTKEEKKKLREERKKLREKRKKKYGIALVDGVEVEIANYIAEPSCIFMGRGENPYRGKWKNGPREEDFELNLSPEASTPQGNWKGRMWEPNKLWIARWKDKLSGKIKYVWLSDTWSKKQEREKAKFEKASKLEENLEKIKHLIGSALYSEGEERRKLACVCYLIHNLNMRVGDEHEEGEADTVGAITLKPEHIKIEGNLIHLKFLGKDSVLWERTLNADPKFIKNLKEFMNSCESYIFEGINSKKVAKFLQEAVDGLTAKVFRTWRITKTVREFLKKQRLKKNDPEWKKKLIIKFANLEGAKIANHKRKIPSKFEERIKKKEERISKLREQIKEKKKKNKKIEKDLDRLKKYEMDYEFTLASKEYTLGTSLRSYIDPRVFQAYCKKVDFPLEKVYSSSLLKKFSWSLK